jgi:hypothetical protein
VRVPLAAGVVLPQQGVNANQKTLTISTKTGLGPVDPPVSIMSSPGVLAESSFTITALDFEPKLALTPARITIKFAVDKTNMYVGDQIIVTLPYFTGPGHENLMLSGSIPAKSNFNNVTFVMVLTLEADVEPGTLVELIVPVTANISTPSRGVSANQETLTIESTSMSGPIKPGPFLTAPFIDCKFLCVGPALRYFACVEFLIVSAYTHISSLSSYNHLLLCT